MVTVSLPRLLSLALAVRICLVLYGEIHDQHSLLKYTDVDYKVFSDAARHVCAGGSPYQRLTYRSVYARILGSLNFCTETFFWLLIACRLHKISGELPQNIRLHQ